jgi:hypothetical protein
MSRTTTRPEPIATDAVTVVRADLAQVERRGPLKYADPAAWLVRLAVDGARRTYAGPPDGPVGVIGVSEFATGHSLRAVAADAAAGHSSPRRFVAASPGTLIGLSCIEFGYDGPSMLLTMPETPGRELAAVIAGSWLTGDPPAAARVALVSYVIDAPGVHRATCRWLLPAGDAGGAVRR